MATVPQFNSVAALIIRTAISARLAAMTLLKIGTIHDPDDDDDPGDETNTDDDTDDDDDDDSTGRIKQSSLLSLLTTASLF
jgi:hypothetical protein